MTKPVILVADDDPQVRASIRRDLRSHCDGYTVIAASSGEEAVDTIRGLKARGTALAMVLSDQRMPGMQGVELLARAREIYPISRRVLLTAYSDIDAAVRAINEARSDYYLSKPWHPPEERLFPVVDDLLEAWQADRPPEAEGLRVLGRQWSARSHAVKNFLAGNLIPYRWYDVERDGAGAELMKAGGFGESDLPVVLLEDGAALRNPTVREVAERLSRPVEAAHELYDLVIVGAGPAGLAAAVYGASEGLKTLLLDRHAPGGQAGTSARIENYLGFPTGVSGAELTRRAILQAQRLGAEFLAPVEVVSVSVEGSYKRIALSEGRTVVARAMIVATGMDYREHPAEGVAALTGAGVYYGAAATEAQACRDARVMIVGGGNSAGQCAIYLSRIAREVNILVRRDGLRDTMSHYLIGQIEQTANIHLRGGWVLQAVEGVEHLERVLVRCVATGDVSTEPMDAVFVFIGTRPHSAWLPDSVLRDDKGFVLTGQDGRAAAPSPRAWHESRPPLPLETTVPGIFAAGDVRAGAMNRVAAAVGEGAMAVRLVHEYLALT